MMRKATNTPTSDAPITHAVVAVDALTPHDRNYRRHPESQIGRLSSSLTRFSQVRSIVVQQGADGRYLIVAGHGVVEAARRNGLTELHADVIPATWTAQQVAGYLISDNETARGADDDLTLLAEMLQEQVNAGESLEALGYNTSELDALLMQLADEAIGDDAPPPTFKDFDEHVEDDLPTEMCTQCGKLCLKAGAKAPKS